MALVGIVRKDQVQVHWCKYFVHIQVGMSTNLRSFLPFDYIIVASLVASYNGTKMADFIYNHINVTFQ